MAKISKKDLEHMSSEQIRKFYTSEDFFLLDPLIKNYVDAGKEDFSMGNRINRVEKILNIIVVERFINGTL